MNNARVTSFIPSSHSMAPQIARSQSGAVACECCCGRTGSGAVLPAEFWRGVWQSSEKGWLASMTGTCPLIQFWEQNHPGKLFLQAGKLSWILNSSP